MSLKVTFFWFGIAWEWT